MGCAVSLEFVCMARVVWYHWNLRDEGNVEIIEGSGTEEIAAE